MPQFEVDKVNLCMIGFASDIGASACESRTGAEKGSECVRELMKQSTMQWFEEDELRVKLWDCGDVKFHSHLTEAVKLITSKVPNSVILVIGGTDDMNLSVAKGMDDSLSIVRVESSLDVAPKFKKQAFKDGPITYEDLHHLSNVRMLIEEQSSRLQSLTVFGVQGHKVT